MSDYRSEDVTLWFPDHWKDDSDVRWDGNGAVEWAFRRVPAEGENIWWQQSHRFEVVGIMTATDDDSAHIHLRLEPATEAERQHLHAQGGLCLRDQLILARESGTSWDRLSEEYELLPSTMLRYLREQKELAEDRDLVAEVIAGGERGVDTTDLDTAAVLAALWNHLPPGFQARTEPLTTEEARSILAEREGRISALFGRPLQVVLTGSRFNPWLYDQEALHSDHILDSPGHATARGVVEHLRATGSVTGAPLARR